MTKVLIEFELTKALNETLMKRIAAAHGQYGLLHLQLAPGMDRLTVEYDASRLTGQQVETLLHRLGIPVRRVDCGTPAGETP